MAEVWEELGYGVVPWMSLRCDGIWKPRPSCVLTSAAGSAPLLRHMKLLLAVIGVTCASGQKNYRA